MVGFISRGVAAQPSAPPFRLVEDIRIDGAQHDLSGVGFLVVTRDGSIVISEPQDFRLRFYDATGREVARYGRKGAGPGEFGANAQMTPQYAMLIGGTRSDTAWVYDRVLRRFLLFSRDGKFVRTIAQPDKLPGLMGGQRPKESKDRTLLSFDPVATFPMDNMLGRARYGRLEPVRRSDGSTTLVSRSAGTDFAIATPKGDIVKRVAVQPEDGSSVVVQRSNGLRSWSTSVPYLIRPFTAVAQNGSRIAFAETTPSDNGGFIRVTVMAGMGDTLLSRSYPFSGVRLKRSTVDSAIRVVMARYQPDRNGRLQAPPDVVVELENRLRAAMPTFAAPVSGLLVGIDNSIWLGLERSSEGRRYLVLDERGDPVGTVTVPFNASLNAASRDQIWVTERDQDDLPSLVRYRLQPAR